MRHCLLPIGIIVVLCLALSSGCSGVDNSQSKTFPESSSIQSSTSSESSSVSSVVTKVSPSVVFIDVDYPNYQSSGTGMLITTDGYVLTNEHVVSKGSHAKLNIPNRINVEAQIIYRDPILDIAILKCDGSNYSAVTLGSTKKPELGEDVIALGYPSAAQLGESVSLSKGIISAFRTINGVKYIQTDASLNPGSSGGPLVNTRGEVIGMNSWKLTESEGINFAIDINSIRMLIESIVQQHIDDILNIPEPSEKIAGEQISLSTPPKAEEAEWSNTFGGVKDDYAYSVQLTTDGGYIITGFTDSFRVLYHDVYLIKTNERGDEIWSKNFGGEYEDVGFSVQQTSDGGYIIAGMTAERSDTSSRDVYLIKVDSTGKMQWSKTFGGANADVANSVKQTPDGGYIITGYTNSFGSGFLDVYLIKTNASGDKIWSKTFGGEYEDVGKAVCCTSDGGYIVIGHTDIFGVGNYDAYLLKVDNSGDMLWSKTFGGEGHESGYYVQQTSDGGYVITGSTTSSGAGSHDAFLLKTDSLGNVQWSKIFGGANEDVANCVQQTSDGGYIITGYTKSYGAGSRDAYLMNFDSVGKMQWINTFGSTNDDVANCVEQTPDGGYIITGYTKSYGAGSYDTWLIKYRR